MKIILVNFSESTFFGTVDNNYKILPSKSTQDCKNINVEAHTVFQSINYQVWSTKNKAH